MPTLRKEPLPYRPKACGDYSADYGHDEFDPECDDCLEANSDTPEWTI